MKVTTKTIKGWPFKTDLMTSPNITNVSTFENNLKNYIENHLQGYTKLPYYLTLRGCNATHKVIIKAWRWRGSWASPKCEIYEVYYK